MTARARSSNPSGGLGFWCSAQAGHMLVASRIRRSRTVLDFRSAGLTYWSLNHAQVVPRDELIFMTTGSFGVLSGYRVALVRSPVDRSDQRGWSPALTCGNETPPG
jgi:hypothetical protein